MFTLVSYNILADAYVRSERYPLSPPEALDPRRRLAGIEARLRTVGADVLCLQEIESAVFDSLTRSLEPLGYDGRFARKQADRPDGCATFFRTDAFEPVSERILVYTDGRGAADSGHIALMVVLLYEGRPIGVANTHLKWSPPETPRDVQWGYRQVRQLIDAIERYEPSCAGWIVCGDFNAPPGSAIVREPERVGFVWTHRGPNAAPTCNANLQARVLDYIFHSRALRSEPVPPSRINDATPLPSLEEPSDHLPVLARFGWRSENGR